jgi:folate-binding Fe-S cluster repair protein YgfZ
LSADIDALTPARALPASCKSAQGRVQAVLWLTERADGIALLLPRR